MSRSRFAVIVSVFRQGAAALFRLCPAFPAVMALAFGIVTVLGRRFWDSPALSWVGLAGFIAFFGLRWFGAGRRPGRLMELFWFGCGLGLTWLHLAIPRDSYMHALPRAPCRVEARGIVASPLYQGDGLPQLRRRPSSEILLRAIRVSGASRWRRVRGRILARLPAGTRGPPYGAEVQLTGLLAEPGRIAFPGAFDYRRYLLCGGIRHVLTVERASLAAAPRGWRRLGAFLFRIRDRLVDRVVRGIRSSEDAQLLAAITLGCRQGLDRGTRLQFVRSGAVHIFAISGLHVGIFAGLLLLVLRTIKVPFRLRYWLLPLPLGLYVFLTGGHPSGVRAWIMVSLWSWGRAAYLPAAPLNTVGLAALLLLVTNPLNLARSGFQFSFTIVVTLILGWPLISKVAALVDERSLWVPLRLRSRWTRNGIRRRAVQLLGGASLAWLGSAGLVAWYNSVAIPGGIIVNLFVGPLAWGALFMSSLKLSLGCLPFWRGPELLAGRCLELGLSGMRGMTALGAQPPSSLAVNRPGMVPLLLYYAFLLLALQVRLKPRYRCAAGVGLVAVVILAWPHLRDPGFRVVAAAGPGAAVPAVAVRWAKTVPPVIVNAGNSRTGRLLAEWLLRHGVREVDTLVLAGVGRPTAGGTAVLLDSLDVHTVVCFRADRIGTELSRVFREYGRRGGRLRLIPRSLDRAGSAFVSCSGVGMERIARGTECELRIVAPMPARALREVRIGIGAQQAGTVAVRRGEGRPWEMLLRARSSLNGRLAVLPSGGVIRPKVVWGAHRRGKPAGPLPRADRGPEP